MADITVEEKENELRLEFHAMLRKQSEEENALYKLFYDKHGGLMGLDGPPDYQEERSKLLQKHREEFNSFKQRVISSGLGNMTL